MEGDPAPCSVYSTGSKENSFFEVEVMALTNCTVFAYEPSAAVVDHPLGYFEDRVNLQSLAIGGKDGGHLRTLKTLMQTNGNQDWVDVVKLSAATEEDDNQTIEALEKVLEDFAEEDSLPIGQLLVRLNVGDWNKKGASRRILSIFEDLEDKGLRLFHAEASSFSEENVADFSFGNSAGLSRFLEGKDLEKYIKKSPL